MQGEHKGELRRAILARRDALGAERRVELSRAIFAEVTALDAFRHARTVLAYSSFGSEPETEPFLRTILGLGKTLALPRVRRELRTLELYRVEEPATELAPGVWGIREPDPGRCPVVPLPAVDFILVPGVVFDAEGGRIGYGGGYYDRLIERCRGGPALVAAAFELQVVDRVPVESHDRRVDRVVTERRAYPGGRGGGLD